MAIYKIGNKLLSNGAGKMFGFTVPEPEPETVEILGKTYTTCIIGNQVWLAENLKTASKAAFPNLQVNPTINTNSDFYNLVETVYLYNKGGENYFYNGKARDKIAEYLQANNIGYHIPTQAEWQVLFDYINTTHPNHYEGEDYIWSCDYLRSIEGWTGTNIKGKDYYGFNAEPIGYIYNTTDTKASSSKNSNTGTNVLYWSSASNFKTAKIEANDSLNYNCGYIDENQRGACPIRLIKDS